MLVLAGCAGSPDSGGDLAQQLLFQRPRMSDSPPPPRSFELRPRVTVPANRPSDTAVDWGMAEGRAPAEPAGPPRETASLAPAARPTGPAPALLTPARLKGLTGSELKAMLGDPTLLRSDGPAQLWQYSGSGCVLHVFLYEDLGAFRVTYSQVRIDDPDVANPPTCVDGKSEPQARL